MEGILLGLGNPLLDLIVEVNADFLKKYGLKATGEILADDDQKQLFVEVVDKFKPVFVPGGSTQNTIRIAQWLIRQPRNATTFLGCRGKDNFGEKLEQMMKEVGVKTSYQVSKKPSGACAVCLTGKQRSLVAYLGASKLFTVDHLDSPINVELIDKAQFYYMAGIDAFSEANDLKLSDTKDIARRIARWRKENGSRSRMIIVYQGYQPTIVVKEGKLVEFQTNRIPDSEINDLSGENDAFVGGFLARLVHRCPLACCIASGHYAANYILRQSGVQLFGDPTFSCTGHPH